MVQAPMLGKFRYMGKPDKLHTAPVKCIIHMFVMHVAEELDVWPEMGQRQRFWVSSTIRILLYQDWLLDHATTVHTSASVICLAFCNSKVICLIHGHRAKPAHA